MGLATVLIPWRGGCLYRAQALRHVSRNLWRWPVTLCETDGPWCKGAALAQAVQDAPSQTIIVLDADCVIDGIAFAVHAVDHGTPWAVPHTLVHRLTEQSTQKVLQGEPWRNQPLEEAAYTGLIGGGC